MILWMEEIIARNTLSWLKLLIKLLLLHLVGCLYYNIRSLSHLALYPETSLRDWEKPRNIHWRGHSQGPSFEHAFVRTRNSSAKCQTTVLQFWYPVINSSSSLLSHWLSHALILTLTQTLIHSHTDWTKGSLGGAVGSGTALEFFIGLILPVALGPWDRINL